jgi:glycosyltransferase involved in cell wall biosynthesis
MKTDKKKKIVILTDSTLAHTGFGKVARNYIEYLHKTNKYEIIHIAAGMTDADPSQLTRFAWTTYAAVNLQKLQLLKQNNDPKNHEGIERLSSYGAFTLDEVVKKHKPSMVWAIQDTWGVDFAVEKSWFSKIPTVLWVTIDSLPLLPKVIEMAPKVKHFWNWGGFATKEMHRLGFNHVKTVHGPIQTKNFYRLSDPIRLDLRLRNGIKEDTKILGFVFRNQLRKEVYALMEAFGIYKKNNPNTKLLLHTSWQEGWDLNGFIRDYNIDKNDVLTTYVCRACKNYEIKPFSGHDLDCKYCKTQKSQTTPHPTIGVSEKQLNEIYNLMNVYIHPATSGATEIPCVESKLTELPVLVTNYSFGEDFCSPEAQSFPLEYVSRREIGTNFIKAATSAQSIVRQLEKVSKIEPNELRKMGKLARKWAIENYSIDIIGKQLEEFIDSYTEVDESVFDEKIEQKDPTYNIPEIQDNAEWITHMYHNVLKMKDVDSNNDGHRHWMNQISNGMSRKQIEEYFRKVAAEDNSKNNVQQVSLENFLDKSDKERVLLTLKESIGDLYLLTSLLPEVQKKYPLASIYIACDPKYNTIFDGNQYVKKCIPWSPAFENELFVCGQGPNKGLFNYFHNVGLTTQRSLSYLSAKY